jgi:hypothetical protein
LPQVISALGNALLEESDELFNSAEFEFAAAVDFFHMPLELALGEVGLWTQPKNKCSFHTVVQA